MTAQGNLVGRSSARARRAVFKARWMLGEFLNTHSLVAVNVGAEPVRTHIARNPGGPVNDYTAECGAWLPGKSQIMADWPRQPRKSPFPRFAWDPVKPEEPPICKNCIGRMMGPRNG